MFLILNVISLFMVIFCTLSSTSLLLLTSSESQTSPSIQSNLVRRSIGRQDAGHSYGAMRNPPRIEMPVVPPFVKILRKEYKGHDWRVTSSTESQLKHVEAEEAPLDYDESTTEHVTPTTTIPTTTIPTTTEDHVNLDFSIEYPHSDDFQDYADYDSVSAIYNNHEVVIANESTSNLLPLEMSTTETGIVNNEENETRDLESSSNSDVMISREVTQSEALSSNLTSRVPKLLFHLEKNDSMMAEIVIAEDAATDAQHTIQPPFPTTVANSIELPLQPLLPSSSQSPTDFVQDVNKTPQLLPDSKSKSKNKDKNVESLLPRSKVESSGKSKGGGGLFHSLMDMARQKTKLISSTFTQLASVLLGTSSQDFYRRRASRLEGSRREQYE